MCSSDLADEERSDWHRTGRRSRRRHQLGVVEATLVDAPSIGRDRDERPLIRRAAHDPEHGRSERRAKLAGQRWDAPVLGRTDRHAEAALVRSERRRCVEAVRRNRFELRRNPALPTRFAEQRTFALADAASVWREQLDQRGERIEHQALHLRTDRSHRAILPCGTYGRPTAYDTSMPTPARTITVSATPLAGVSVDEWRRLVSTNQTASAFSDRSVHAAWWSAHGDTATDVSLAARDADTNELLGYLPLMERPDGVIYSGATFHIDYATVLLAPLDPHASSQDDSVADALAAALIALQRPLNLLRLRKEDANHARMIDAIVRAAGSAQRTATLGVEEPAPFIDLRGVDSFDAHLERLDKKDRHEIRRKLRRAEAAGVEIAASGDLSADLPEFIRLHRARWGESGLFTPTEKGAAEERFMREIFRAAPAGMITLLLARNAEFGTFAAGLFVRDAQALRYWNAGGDIAARALSPGVLLFAHGLSLAIQDRVARFDFLRGNEPYKYECGAIDAHVMQLQVPT